jgi:hypothetical protein
MTKLINRCHSRPKYSETPSPLGEASPAAVDAQAGAAAPEWVFTLPVIKFIIQRHDLDGLALAMKQAVRKSSCRVFALQVCSMIRWSLFKWIVQLGGVALGS